MSRLGTDGKVTEQKTLIHETRENYEVQVNGMSPQQAHLAGGNAENRLGGAILNPLNRNITTNANLPFVVVGK